MTMLFLSQIIVVIFFVDSSKSETDGKDKWIRVSTEDLKELSTGILREPDDDTPCSGGEDLYLDVQYVRLANRYIIEPLHNDIIYKLCSARNEDKDRKTMTQYAKQYCNERKICNIDVGEMNEAAPWVHCYGVIDINYDCIQRDTKIVTSSTTPTSLILTTGVTQLNSDSDPGPSISVIVLAVVTAVVVTCLVWIAIFCLWRGFINRSRAGSTSREEQAVPQQQISRREEDEYAYIDERHLMPASESKSSASSPTSTTGIKSPLFTSDATMTQVSGTPTQVHDKDPNGYTYLSTAQNSDKTSSASLQPSFIISVDNVTSRRISDNSNAGPREQVSLGSNKTSNGNIEGEYTLPATNKHPLHVKLAGPSAVEYTLPIKPKKQLSKRRSASLTPNSTSRIESDIPDSTLHEALTPPSPSHLSPWCTTTSEHIVSSSSVMCPPKRVPPQPKGKGPAKRRASLPRHSKLMEGDTVEELDASLRPHSTAKDQRTAKSSQPILPGGHLYDSSFNPRSTQGQEFYSRLGDQTQHNAMPAIGHIYHG